MARGKLDALATAFSEGVSIKVGIGGLCADLPARLWRDHSDPEVRAFYSVLNPKSRPSAHLPPSNGAIRDGRSITSPA